MCGQTGCEADAGSPMKVRADQRSGNGISSIAGTSRATPSVPKKRRLDAEGPARGLQVAQLPVPDLSAMSAGVAPGCSSSMLAPGSRGCRARPARPPCRDWRERSDCARARRPAIHANARAGKDVVVEARFGQHLVEPRPRLSKTPPLCCVVVASCPRNELVQTDRSRSAEKCPTVPPASSRRSESHFVNQTELNLRLLQLSVRQGERHGRRSSPRHRHSC